MSFTRSSGRTKLASLVSAAVALTGAQLALAPAAEAASSTLVINEVYVNGGSTGATYRNKFVEIRNRTNSAISLAGMSVQYRSGSGAANADTTAPLSGSVPPNGLFLVGGASNGANGATLPTPDLTTTFNPGGNSSGGTIALVNGTAAVNPTTSAAVVDRVGFGPSNGAEGTPTTGYSVTKSLGRTGASTDTDNNSADFAAQDPTPGTANPGSTNPGNNLAATNPGDKTFPAGDPITPFTLTATGGTSPYSWGATGLPNGLSINSGGTVSGTPTTGGTSSVTATVTDSASPAANASTMFSVTVTTTGPLAIADIQGTGATTPLAGQTVTTQGVVTAAYPTGGLNGFYLQTPGEDVTPDASDGIFVYGGTSGFGASTPAVGDSVRVTGVAGEFSGATQITATAAGLTVLGTPLGDVIAKTAVPGTDCAEPGTAGTACPIATTDLDAAREKIEGEVVQPTAPWTTTDVYDFAPFYNNTNSSSFFGEIGLAAGSDKPLVSPTEVVDAQATAAVAARKAYNDAHRIILDDASSLNYTTAANTSSPFPWLTASHSVRVGAAVTFPAPVVFTYGFNTWRILPTTRVVGAPTATQPQFAQTRAANLTPQPVGGDVKLATFNVLNFFPTTAEEFDAGSGNNCTYYTDRAGNRITANQCTPDGPRGAADDANLVRQRDKIVSAINGSGADVVSLEELENSVKYGKSRDFAISALVTALNADAGAGTWDFVPSPAAADLPSLAEQDVIRTGFIYKPGVVATVGDSVVLTDSAAFSNAREPLAQAFKKVGTPNNRAFAVIVNHFKSKGSGTPDPNGQGNANADRVAQANALVTFADDFQSARNITRTFLVGDFNAYSQEDPIQVLTAAGYTNLESTSDPDEESYNFDGQIGSLDHVLANGAAAADVNAVDIWPINSYESVYYEYSRYNYNATNLYSDGPFRSSDHNPEIVGINVAAKIATTTTAADVSAVQGTPAPVEVTVTPATGTATPTGDVTVSRGGAVVGTATLSGGTATVSVPTGLAPGTYTLTAAYEGDDDFAASSVELMLTVTSAVKPVQILATNDFHGRLVNDTSSTTAGAAVLAGAVKQLRAQNPATVFAAAGDLIGASTFESFIAQDKPTIDALNEAGLEVSAVGNHEFDQGYDDLVNRVMAPYDADTNPYGGAQWKYLGANVKFKESGDDAIDGTWIKDMGGVQVGFVGAVTEHLPELVSPAGIEDIKVTDIVDATNAAAEDLKAEGADLVVLLVHEGAASTDCATMDDDPNSDFGSIITGVNDDVDAIVSGHTHLAYNCSFPVAGWSDRAVTERPVVSAGQYGSNLNKLVFDVDTRNGEVVAKTQAVLPLKAGTSGSSFNYPVDQPTKEIVDRAVAQADVLGAVELGKIAAPLKRGVFAPPATGAAPENRGAESTLGNLVAEVQQWATETPTAGSAQIAFMNPGGLRADLLGNAGAGTARTVTYKQAATVQPFANTLVNVKMTGAQVKTALEQQWQPTGASRPFLRLGTSEGFNYTYDPSAATGSHVSGMWLNGAAIDPTTTYSVTVNSFLASGGDNFGAFNVAAGLKQDTGQTDLQAMVDYLDEFANTAEGDDPLPIDYSQRSVGTVFPAGAPAVYRAGDHVRFNVSSFSMTNADDVKDSAVTVKLGDAVLGTFPLDNAPQAGSSGGFDEVGKASVDVVLPANVPSGTVQLDLVGTDTGTSVPVFVEAFTKAETVTATRANLSTKYRVAKEIPVTVSGGSGVPTGTVEIRLGTTVLASADLGATGRAVPTVPAGALTPGQYDLTAVYSGDAANAGSSAPVRLTVLAVVPQLSSTSASYDYGQGGTIKVRIAATAGFDPTGTVTVLEDGVVIASVMAPGNTSPFFVPFGPTQLAPGVHNLTVQYSGDVNVAGATTTASVTVAKGTTSVSAAVTAPPKRNQPVRLNVAVTGPDGVPVTGNVRVAVQGGSTQTLRLVDGAVQATVGPFGTVGRRTVTVTYLGSAVLKGSNTTVRFNVTN